MHWDGGVCGGGGDNGGDGGVCGGDDNGGDGGVCGGGVNGGDWVMHRGEDGGSGFVGLVLVVSWGRDNGGDNEW